MKISCKLCRNYLSNNDIRFWEKISSENNNYIYDCHTYQNSIQFCSPCIKVLNDWREENIRLENDKLNNITLKIINVKGTKKMFTLDEIITCLNNIRSYIPDECSDDINHQKFILDSYIYPLVKEQKNINNNHKLELQKLNVFTQKWMNLDYYHLYKIYIEKDNEGICYSDFSDLSDSTDYDSI